MAVVRAVLALALALTAVWLVAIAAEQVDGTWRQCHRARGCRDGCGPGRAGMVVAARSRSDNGGSLPVWRSWPPGRLRCAPHPSRMYGRRTGAGRDFDPGRITGLVAAGRVVFVDVTADWCLTCKVNDAVVLGTDPVSGQLATPDVVPMRADWTRPDDAIARYLAGFGRYGIPFNAVYGPGAPDGVALPELLSPGTVLDALAEARGSS